MKVIVEAGEISTYADRLDISGHKNIWLINRNIDLYHEYCRYTTAEMKEFEAHSDNKNASFNKQYSEFMPLRSYVITRSGGFSLFDRYAHHSIEESDVKYRYLHEPLKVEL